ncbi:hypothetical protein DFP72DRAFT_827887 [Ephemerocybe angulata]|uniref:Ubiquitin-like protease family profile domain-containing protein n=1 Tax=Ephemerocybe angulata TaxID=980116 RepID=A0A8H6HAJ7_9AGAR|nr:hypothetical protein DFP72DRAFT_827887 [Tulosesus angulatus]
MEGDYIEDSDDEASIPFIESEYIGVKKKYPAKDTPGFIERALKKHLTVPRTILKTLPGRQASVKSLLDFAIPSQSQDLALLGVSNFFSRDAPATSPSTLFTCRIPSSAQLRKLREAAGQAWFDGYTSIVDPRFPDEEKLPFWAISFWQELLEIRDAQSMWKKSRAWCRTETEKRQRKGDYDAVNMLETVEEQLGRLPWGARMEFERGYSTSLLLSYFLGPEWLTDSHLNMMVQVLTERLPPGQKTMIAPLAFSNDINNVDRKLKVQSERWNRALLAQYEHRIKNEGIEALYFPLHVNGNHWIAGKVDFVKYTVSYGDPMKGLMSGIPATFDRMLCKWLKYAFNRSFKNLGNCLPRTTQPDSFSCGMLTVNIIAHSSMGTNLWEAKHGTRHRLEWFMEFSKRLLDQSEEIIDIDGDSESTHPDAQISPAVLAKLDTVVIQGDHNFPGLARMAIANLVHPMPENDTPPNLHPSPAPKHAEPPLYSQKSASESSIEEPSSSESESSSDDDSGGDEPDESPVPQPVPNPKAARKRPERSVNYAEESDAEDSEEERQQKRICTETDIEKSRSAKAAKANRDKMKAGEYTPNTARLGNWKAKVAKLDPKAGFKNEPPEQIYWAQCSKCAHEAGAGPSEASERYRAVKAQGILCESRPDKEIEAPCPSSTTSTPVLVPCPGLTNLDDNRVPRYLQRTSVSGGGARALHIIAKEKYGKVFSDLETWEEQQDVLDTQYHERRWVNDHNNLRVFSSACEKTVVSGAPKRNRPCSICASLLTLKKFKVALKKLPAANAKFIPHRFQNTLIGELFLKCRGLADILNEDSKKSPFIKIARAYLDGRLEDKQVFKSIITAVATQIDKEERGVGMQNFKYPPAWEEMCQILRDISPQAYEALSKHIQMPAGRNLRMKRAREPRFPMEINDTTFDNVAEQLKKLNYTGGHVALSCDDTKLFPGYRLYYDGEDKCHYLVGGTEGRLRVADPDQVREVLEDANSIKASKLRLWCLTLPLPKVTPIIVAALPISDALDHEDLFKLLRRVLDGLIDRGVRVVSYASDGTEVERKVQKELLKLGTPVDRVIKNPFPNRPDTRFHFTIYRGQAICVIQDSKHALKTLRNNLFTGARLLTFGNSVAAYRRIRELVDSPGSPLPKRDVEKVDRQDDNAACRLFSAGVLEYLIEHHKEDATGEIAYLFIFGELIDAFQNRSIPHAERIQMALRARYFLDTWTAYLEVSEHSKTQHHISREALDILDILIQGLLALVVIHRDYVDGIAPLVPWLNSTEPCEHVFGSARRVVKDFTFLDFIYMIPKLRIKLREAVFYAKASDPKARASGYNHTYFDNAGIDLIALGSFPSDSDIDAIADAAAQEADVVSSLVGMNAQQIFRIAALPKATPRPQLPSIPQWYTLDDADSDASSIQTTDSEYESSVYEGEAILSQNIQNLVAKDAESPQVFRTEATNKKMEQLAIANVAVATDDAMRVYEFAETGDEQLTEIVAEEYQDVRDYRKTLVAASKVSKSATFETSRPFRPASIPFHKLDFDIFVELRQTHQTRQAALGLCNRSRVPRAVTNAQAARLRIESQMQSILSDEQRFEGEKGVGSGVERELRWRKAAKGGRDGIVDGESVPALAAGSEANAGAAAEKTAKEVCDCMNYISIYSFLWCSESYQTKQSVRTSVGPPAHSRDHR